MFLWWVVSLYLLHLKSHTHLIWHTHTPTLHAWISFIEERGCFLDFASLCNVHTRASLAVHAGCMCAHTRSFFLLLPLSFYISLTKSCTHRRTHPCTGAYRNLHELTLTFAHSSIETLNTEDLTTHTQSHTRTPPLSLSQCSMKQLLKAVGSQLLTSHLIIPLDRHKILSFSLSVSLSVSFALTLIFLFLLCFSFFSFSLFLILLFLILLCLVFPLYSFFYDSLSFSFFSFVLCSIFVFTRKSCY